MVVVAIKGISSSSDVSVVVTSVIQLISVLAREWSQSSKVFVVSTRERVIIS